MKAIYTGSYLLNQKRKREPGTVSETREAVPAKSPLWAGVSGRTQRVPINLHNQCVHWDFVPSRIGFPLNKLKFRLLYILAQDGLQSPPAPRAPTSNAWRFPPPGNRREGGAGKHFRRLTALAGRSRMEPFGLTADTSLRLICAKPCLRSVKGRANRMMMSQTLRVPIAAAAVLVGVLLSAPAFAQAHIRGTLTAAKDGTISVQTAKGGTESIKLANDAGLFLVTKADMSAIQSGKFVGITSVEQGGKRVAREVHVFADSLRGLAEGHYPWDLESEPNMMTNANIAKVEEVGTDRVLRLNYSGGEQTITIPTSATVVAFDKAPADQLAAGRKVFVIMKKDGSEAAAVVIGAEGVKPPM